MPAKVISLIHLQAARLALKRVPFFPQASVRARPRDDPAVKRRRRRRPEDRLPGAAAVCAAASSSCATPTVAAAGSATAHGPRVVVELHRPEAFWRKLALRTRVGFGESYVDGDWDADDLVAALRAALAQPRRRRAQPVGRPALPAAGAAPASPAAADAGHRAQVDPRPLRPRQRALPADARPDDDLLVRVLGAAGDDARGGAGREVPARSARSSTSAATITCSRSAAAGAASRSTPPASTAAASPP